MMHAMKTDPFVLDVRPVRTETLSAREDLKLQETSPGLIERAEFVPPRQGDRGFGRFVVRYSRARHRVTATNG